MLNRPRLLAVLAIGLFGSAIAVNQWNANLADKTAALSADDSAVLVDKLLTSRMTTYGAIDQSVLKVDPAQQLTLQTRVDDKGAGVVQASVRSAKGAAESRVAKSTTAEPLTTETSALTGVRGQNTRWERFEFDDETAIASVAPIGWVASGFAGGSGYVSWALPGGSNSGSAGQAFNWPTSLEQSAASLSGLVAENAVETAAPAKVETSEPAVENTGPIQSSAHEVAEPGNWSLMALGLLMLFFWRRNGFVFRTR